MNHYDQAWQRLTTAARNVPAEEDVAAPYGFATRLAALGLAAPRESRYRLFEKFALRGLVAAAAFSMAAVAFGYSTWASDRDDDTVAVNDTVGEILSTS